MKQKPKNIHCVKCFPKGFSFDSEKSKEIWGKVDSIELVDNITGKKPLQNTWVKFGWTESHLYSLFHCEDVFIAANITEHDNKDLWKENAVELFLDPLKSRHIYYELQVNCRNTGFDGIVHLASGQKSVGMKKGIQCFTDWDPLGYIHKVTGKGKFNKSAKKDEFWEVELSIAFEEFYMTGQKIPRKGEQWYFNAFRVDSGPWGRELYALNATLMEDFHVSSKFAILEFII